MSLAMPLAMPLARPLARALAALLAAGTIAACTDTTTAPDESMLDRHAPRGDAAPDARAHTLLAGGAMTVFDVTAGAFENAAPNLSPAALARHESGDDAFSTVFVPAPADVNPGLGPVFMNASCEACHVGDGRGRPPEPGAPFASLLFRVSVSGDGPHGGPSPVPGFGTQLELSAVPGLTPMITASVTYAESTATYGDGSTYSLRVPRYTFQGEYAPLPAVMLVSPRVAPAVFGDGLLEAVPESEILERAGRHDGYDGGQRVSGRANMVWDAVSRRYALGRFGWKANVPTLLQQSAGAYNGDMGVTSSLFPAEPCEGYVTGCDRHAPEVADSTVAATAFYTQTLGVPARRDLDAPQVQEGERVFYEAGCADCHTPTLVTGELPGLPEASNQEIHPYTDLLVHDMGPALADGRPDFGASGSEWRTPPLWGIGLVKVVNGHTMLLHDGRARSLLEAVLWHGGEATHAREHVRHATAKARAALVAFLESL
ncbi:MAG TPA: di-heme oxidoredictase family protein [Gemmatimonadaceae bacterium]